MGFWWKKDKLVKKQTLEEKHDEMLQNQPDSLLEAFVQYVNTHRKNELELSVEFKEVGVMTFNCKFATEKTYEISLRNDTPFICQRDPEVLVKKLYQNKKLNRVIEAFHDMEKRQEELNDLKEELDRVTKLIENNESIDAYQEMLEVNEAMIFLKTKQRERDEYVRKLWSSSPYLAERLHVIYKEFVRYQENQPSDPVEADLMAIIEDAKLSADTKMRAEEMLAEYKEQKRLSAQEESLDNENQALLTLRTIETHYLKGVASRDMEAKELV